MKAEETYAIWRSASLKVNELRHQLLPSNIVGNPAQISYHLQKPDWQFRVISKLRGGRSRNLHDNIIINFFSRNRSSGVSRAAFDTGFIVVLKFQRGRGRIVHHNVAVFHDREDGIRLGWERSSRAGGGATRCHLRTRHIANFSGRRIVHDLGG